MLLLTDFIVPEFDLAFSICRALDRAAWELINRIEACSYGKLQAWPCWVGQALGASFETYDSVVEQPHSHNMLCYTVL